MWSVRCRSWISPRCCSSSTVGSRRWRRRRSTVSTKSSSAPPPGRTRTRSVGSSGTWRGCRTTTSPTCSAPSRSGSVATGPAAAGSSPIPPTPATGTAPRRSAPSGPRAPSVLLDYLAVVQARTTEMLEGLAPEDLDRVVDRRWDPPVTLGVRLVSVADDCLQHAGTGGVCAGPARLLSPATERKTEPATVRPPRPVSVQPAWASARTPRSGRRSRTRARCRPRPPSVRPGASRTTSPIRRPGW